MHFQLRSIFYAFNCGYPIHASSNLIAIKLTRTMCSYYYLIIDMFIVGEFLITATSYHLLKHYPGVQFVESSQLPVVSGV